MPNSSTSKQRATAPADCDAREFAIQVARIADANRCTDVVVLDLGGHSPLSDFFVLGTGTSARQMHATLDRMREFAHSVDRRAFRVADTSDAHWILADYIDVVVHLFDSSHRDYYDIDGLWDEAPRVPWDDGAPGAASA